jgi:hypothetical protein
VDISKASCANCDQPMSVTKVVCRTCSLVMEGDFEMPPLTRLKPEDQAFVVAFVRHHGSIKKMEGLFDISYPTVKNRLNAISAALDKSFEAPSSNGIILEQLARGEISVDEALERMNG